MQIKRDAMRACGSHGSIRRLLSTVAVLMVINRGIMPTLATAAASSSNDALAQNPHDDDDDGSGGGTERILSRKRRYLIFPQGSSLQLGE